MIQNGIGIYWAGAKPEKPLPEGFQYLEPMHNAPTKAYRISDGRRFLLRKNPDALVLQCEGYPSRYDFDNPILL